jgi:hypothetical protein
MTKIVIFKVMDANSIQKAKSYLPCFGVSTNNVHNDYGKVCVANYCKICHVPQPHVLLIYGCLGMD